jgi:DNA-binding transcriptional regulator YiaG
MEELKLETFLYEDLGFPILLVNAPMKKVFGEWVIDINLNRLRREALDHLIHKSTPLVAGELRFIRKYLEMSAIDFGKILGVTHAAVLKWESGKSRISMATDLCIRFYILQRLHAKNEEFGSLWHTISPEKLSQHWDDPNKLLKIEAGYQYNVIHTV